MKRLIPVTIFLCFLLVLYLALPRSPFARWRENQRRVQAQSNLSRLVKFPLHVPQSQRELKRPSDKYLQSVFPNGVSDVVQNADRLILYSIEPHVRRNNITHWFHNHPVLGQIEFSEAAQKQKLRDSLYDGLAEPVLMYVNCFEPRHGLRAVKGKDVVDFVICFECKQFETYRGAQKIGTRNGSIGKAPEATFNEILTKANIPLSP